MQITKIAIDPVTAISILALGVIMALLIWQTPREIAVRRQFRQTYGFDDAFAGRRYACKVMIANAESSSFQCCLGADAHALYVMAPADSEARNSWRRRLSGLGYRLSLGGNLRLPWADLTWRPRTWARAEQICFALAAAPSSFDLAVPRNVGAQLLADRSGSLPP